MKTKVLLLFIGLYLGLSPGGMMAQTGAALDFDGVNDFVNVPSSASLESYGTTNQITIEYWVKPNGVLNNGFDPLLTKRFNSNTAGILINQATAAGVHTHWLRFTTGWQRIDVPYTVGAWNHVAVTYQSGSGMRVYVNGVQAGSNPINGVLAVNNAPLQIGGETAFNAFKYSGQIDEVRMWNRSLSATEINASYACQLSGNEAGLIAYYQFNEGVAGGGNAGVTSLPDISGNGNTGTLQNFALNGATSNWVAPGGVPSGVTCSDPAAALDFDGNDNIVNIPSTATLESYATTNAITVEYWVNPDPTLNYTPTPTQSQVFEPLVSKRFTSNNAGILIDKLTAAGVHTHWLRFTTGWERIDVSYPTNTWSHVALTYESGSGMNVFINGVQVGTNPVNGQLVVNSAPLQIGGETAVYGYKYRGQIDEFRMWDRALSATEINDQKDCELPGGQPGLLAYYQFNEGTAAGPNAGVINLPDISGNGHNGTLHDFTLSGPNSNWVAPGGVTSGLACILDPCANDTEAPTIVCNSGNGNITVNNDPGQCGAVVSYNVAPNDNCSIQSVAQTSGFANGVLHPVGTTTNTFVVTDSAGNTGTCSFDVTVTDNEGPTIDCSVSAGAPNLLSNSSFENAGFNQLFNDVDWSRTGAVFGIDAIILPPAQDGNRYLKMFGADSRVSQTVPVNGGDVITASAFVKNASFDPIGQPGGGYIQVTLIGGPAAVITSPFITSNAPLDQWQQISTAPITIPQGVGYTGARMELITQQPGGGAVMWDEAFIGVNGGGLLAGDITVGNDPGQCGAQVSVATPLTTDNCGIASITNDRTNTSDASGFYPVGTTTVNWTAVDQAGFSATCSVNVTVTDTEAPTIECSTGFPNPNANILNNQSFESNNGHNQQNPSDWVQFGPVFTIDQNQLGTAQDGDFYAKMFGGNAGLFQDHPVNPGDEITASIYIMNASFDPMGPVGGGQIKLEWPGTGAPQDVSAVVGASSPLDQWVQVTLTATAPAGATTVRFVAITNLPAGGAAFFDNAFMGNNTSGDGGPIVVNNDPGECGAVVSYNVAPNDNCAIQSVAQTSGFANGVLHPVGTTTNTFVVTDSAGNTATCSFDVTVTDNEGPTIDCSVSAGPANLLSNASFENAVFNQLFNDADWTRTGAVFGIDAIVLPPAQDGNRYLKMFGADSRVSQTVPVTGGDVISASAYVKNASFDPIGQPGGGYIQVTLIGGPAAVITSPFITSIAPIDQWQQISTAPITIPSGVGYTGALVELITQQPGGGAVMWDDAFIGVNGGGLLAGNVTVDNDPGQCGAQVSVATPFTSDNCGIASITNDYTNSSDASGFYPVGTTTVNWTAVDQAGFSATCSVEITVNDAEAPTIECSTGFPDPNANILNNQSFEVNNGHNQQNPSDWVQFGPVFTIDQNQLGMAQDGDFYAKMFSGNAGLFQDHPVNPGDVITASIYIMNASFDPMGPVGGGQIKLEWPGTGAPQDVSAVVGASSPLDQWVQVNLTATAPAGATTVRFVAITNLPAGGAAFFDNAFMGNSTTGDGGPIVVNNDAGVCGAAVTYTVTSSDNCALQSEVQTSGFGNGAVHPVGTTTNTFVATDSAGNTSSCSFEVTVIDNEAPVITCPADASFECVTDVPAPNTSLVTASDNCPGVAVSHTGDASNGATGCAGDPLVINRTYEATDASGNSATCDQVITVEATPITVGTNNCATVFFGYAPSACATIEATATGGCPPYSVLWSNGSTSPTQQVCPNVTTVYTVTYTDAQGCTGTGTVTVNVIDVTCGNNPNNPKVLVCHIPQGNPSNAHNICISSNAVATHLNNHGDHLGLCGAVDPCSGMPLAGGGSNKIATHEAHEAESVLHNSFDAFPNPFSNVTTLRFELNESGPVNLQVFDLYGKLIANVYNGEVEAFQVYETEFRPENVTSGIYQARLVTASGEVYYKKLVFSR